MAMKRCPVCGERYSDTYKNCPFCEEEEYWEEEQEARRPILREGTRSSSHKSPYSIVTPILIVLILLMAALLVYLLYGDKLGGKDSKTTEDNKPGIQTPADPTPKPSDTTPGDDTEPGGDTTPGGENPEGSEPAGSDGGSMPEGGGASGNAGTTPSGGTGTSGGMSYASAAALPSGLTLSTTDFTESVSKSPVKLRVSGGTGTYTWISENPEIATVASDGTVTLVAKGTTNVLVTDGSKKAVCIVRVTGGSAPASNPGTTTAPAAPSTTTPSSGGELKAGKAVVINGGNGVRVRSGPGTDHEPLATIPNGGSVQIVASAGNGWYQVTFSDVGGVTTTGYMKGEFLANA